MNNSEAINVLISHINLQTSVYICTFEGTFWTPNTEAIRRFEELILSCLETSDKEALDEKNS